MDERGAHARRHVGEGVEHGRVLVGAHLGRGREDGALHQAEHVERQQLEALGQQHRVGALGLGQG